MTALAEAYPFPANLDRTPPQGGLAPQSQCELLTQALDEDWDADRLDLALDRMAQDRRA